MSKKILFMTLAAAVLAVAASSAAGATTIPDLPDNVDQAYIADGDGIPEDGTVTLSGWMNTTSAVAMSCYMHATIDFSDDGTTSVTGFSGTDCTVGGFPTCSPTTTATGLGWGDRFGYDTGAELFRDYINVQLDITYGTGCPWSGTYTKTGILSPEIGIFGSTLVASFGAGSGRLTSILGNESWSGSLWSSSGIGADTQLVY